LAESVCGATNWILAPRVSGSRDRPQPSARAASAFPICLLLPRIADTSIARERRADATTRAGSYGRRRHRNRGSRRLAPPVRASRRLTGHPRIDGCRVKRGTRCRDHRDRRACVRKPDQFGPEQWRFHRHLFNGPADLSRADEFWRRIGRSACERSHEATSSFEFLRYDPRVKLVLLAFEVGHRHCLVWLQSPIVKRCDTTRVPTLRSFHRIGRISILK
jgi:hypothetical protein